MLIRLEPPIPMRSPKGPCLAHFLIDDGAECDLKWVTFQDNTGECWTWRNKDIRAQKNITLGREYISPNYNPDDVKLRNIIEKKDKVYWERNQLVCYLSKIYNSWLERHPIEDKEWEDEWKNIVFIEFPEGIYSWHIHDTELKYFDHLHSKEGNSWDGSTTDQKYESLLKKQSNVKLKKTSTPEPDFNLCEECKRSIKNSCVGQGKAFTICERCLLKDVSGYWRWLTQ